MRRRRRRAVSLPPRSFVTWTGAPRTPTSVRRTPGSRSVPGAAAPTPRQPDAPTPTGDARRRRPTMAVLRRRRGQSARTGTRCRAWTFRSPGAPLKVSGNRSRCCASRGRPRRRRRSSSCVSQVAIRLPRREADGVGGSGRCTTRYAMPGIASCRWTTRAPRPDGNGRSTCWSSSTTSTSTRSAWAPSARLPR